MQVQKTIRCKIHSLTNVKEQILTDEYNEYQKLCQEVSEAVDNDYIPSRPYFLFKTPSRYSATVWGAIQSIKRKKQFDNIREQPLYLRNDVFRIEEQRKTKISKHWLQLPTKRKRGGVWLPIIVPQKYEHLLGNKLCDSKITKDRKGKWYAHITVQKEVSGIQIPDNPTILAVDLGERYIATTVSVASDGTVNEVNFYGKGVRGVRRHYNWLRRRLGNRKLPKVIKKVGHTEKRKVNDSLHKISRAIVNKAKEQNAVILLGDLKGIRKSAKGKGRRFNRIVSNMPFSKLSNYITYKALWDRIPVIKDKETGTSKICHRCGSVGRRLSQARFKCDSCGLDYFNADVNAAINQAERGLARISSGGTGLSGSALNFGGDRNG